jgi:GNAT superfamily N-acetyltransferase
VFEIKRMSRNESALLDALDNKHLAGDTVVVRIGRNGLELDFRAGRQSDWLSPLPDAYRRPDAKTLIAGTDGAAYYAWDETKLIGQAVAAKHEFRFAKVCDIRVSLSERKKGVGRALIEALERWAWQQGYSGITAETQDNNPGACQFFLKCGYRFGGVDMFRYAALPERIGTPDSLREAAMLFYKLFK